MRILPALLLTAFVITEPAGAKEPSIDGARGLYRTGRYGEAIEQFAGLRDTDPVPAALGLSKALYEKGRTGEAETLLRQSIAAHPKNADLSALLSQVLLNQGRHDEAKRAAEAAIATDANHIQAHWVMAELIRLSGELDAAGAAYRWFVDHYNASQDIQSAEDLCWIGLAAAQSARWNRQSDEFSFLVNDLYPKVIADDPNFWPAHYQTGRLFLEKYNVVDAGKALAAARKINPNNPDILAALAELAVGNYELDKARRLLDRSLEINPNHIDSLLLEADVTLAMFDAPKALGWLERARKLNGRHEPTLGRLAAVYLLIDGKGAGDNGIGDRGQGVGDRTTQANDLPSRLTRSIENGRRSPNGKPDRASQLIAEATYRNPHAGTFFFHMGQALEKSRKYPDAAGAFAQSLKVMPQMIGPRCQLGLMQMRLGNESAARQVLEESFAIDPFNVRVKNTLEVLDVLAGYEDLKTEHFVLRYDPRHDRVLAKAAARYLEGIYPEITRRLGYEPPQPTLIELFNRAKNTDGHGWFSARMVGLPRIHTIGACAGRMVALTSPTSMKRKHFHWARVLRHELVHVVNLQQTDFNIPHWYTEALAVLLEDRPRPAEWDRLLARRVPIGKVFDLETIDLGFIRPRSSEDWQMAYCQAELYAEYMVDRFGNDTIEKMLAGYAVNASTPATIEKCLGVPLTDFETGYVKWLRQIAAEIENRTPRQRTFAELTAAVEADPHDADAAAELAVAYLRRKEYPKARALADAALTQTPKHQLATYVAAKLHLVVGEREEAADLLLQSLNEEKPQRETLLLLATLRAKDRDLDESERLLKLGAAKFPGENSWTRRLAANALGRGAKEDLARYLRTLAVADGDNVVIRKKLALLAAERGDHTEAARWAEDAIHIDVLDLDMHRLLARSHLLSERPAEAADAYELCVDLAPNRRDLRSAWAEACRAAGQKDRAQAALKPLEKVEDP